MVRARCPVCELALRQRLPGKLISWGSNGTIVMRPNPSFRVVLVESALLEDIYSRIESKLGISIRHIVFEALRSAAKPTIGSMIPAFAPWLIRNRLVLHPTTRFLQDVSRWAGLGDARPVFYHAFRGTMARVRNVFNRDIYAALVVGSFEGVEGIPYDHVWVEIGGESFLLLMPAGVRPEIATRMAPEIAPFRPGNRRLNLCPRCRLPVDLNHLRWDFGNAMITDTRRDVRMSFVDGYAFSVVFRELISELAEDVVPIIIGASREYELRSIEDVGLGREDLNREGRFGYFLEKLPVYGQGNPIKYDFSGDSLSVTIDNPYSVHLLAGQLAAVYETVAERPAAVNWEEPCPMHVLITVSPA